MAYCTVSTASNMKSLYKSPIVTSDNYQVTLAVMRNKAVHITKANVRGVAHQFSHRCTAIHPAGQLPCRWHAAADQTMLQWHHFRSVTLSMGLHRYTPAWHPRFRSRLFVGHKSGAIKCDVMFIWCTVLYEIKFVASFYKVQYEHIKLLRCNVLFTCVCLLPRIDKIGWYLTKLSQISL